MSDAMNELQKFISTHVEHEDVVSLTTYFDKVKEKPHLADLAHKRIYEMIRSYGVEVDAETNEEKYLFFEKELFGIESSTKEIMEYFKGAAMGSDVGKRFLLLFGPPSSGKSNLVGMLKGHLEDWSKTDQGAVYGIEGCPMNEEPLHAIPHAMRKRMSEELGVKIEGELCPLCELKLRKGFKGDFLKFNARRVYFSEQSRSGIGTFVPADPKAQDLAELIGSVDVSKIGEYGTESDPRAFRFDGELNISNRGLMEFIEILKVDPKFLYVLLTATQEKNIKTPRFPLIYCDIAIVSHTNEAEYKEFMGNPKNEALADRMIVCRVPYNLKVSEEVKIYEKLLDQGGAKGIHIAPYTLKVAAILAVLTRLEESKDKTVEKIKKMKLYDNQDVEGLTSKDVVRLRKESQTEGMDGISPRFVINTLATTAIRGSDVPGKKKYITPVDVLRAFKSSISNNSKFKAEDRARFEEDFALVKKEFDEIAQNEVQKAFFASFEDEARILLDNYLDHVEAYLSKSKIEDRITGEESAPNEKLMRSIETHIGISESGKEQFRNEIMRKVASALRKGEQFKYEQHARLRQAIEKQLFEEKRDVIKMTITSRTNQDPEQLKRVNQVVQTLCDKHGYIPESANELLQYVSSIMNREKGS